VRVLTTTTTTTTILIIIISKRGSNSLPTCGKQTRLGCSHTVPGNRNFVPCVAYIMGRVERMGTKYVNSSRKLLMFRFGGGGGGGFDMACPTGRPGDTEQI
jgi:hypothetical protein